MGKTTRTLIQLGSILPLSMALISCGGGSGGGTSTEVVSLKGTVFASSVNGAEVTIENALGERLAGPGTTGSDGSFTLALDKPHLADDLVIIARGGSYRDEATGETKTAGELSGHFAGGSLADGSSASLTPGSSIVHRLVAAGMTRTAARAAFETASGYLPDSSVVPLDITDADNSDGDLDRLKAGLRAGAFSQLAEDLGVNQFALITALTEDLADGTQDGQANGSPVTIGDSSIELPADITARFARSLVKLFQSDRNLSGLDNNQIGQLPSPRTVITDNYRVSFSAGDDGSSMGKDEFQITITDHDGNPATMLNPTVHPHMNMSGGHGHATAVGEVTNNGDGSYDAEIYYVMASVMSNGDSMGWWQLNVCLGNMTMHAMATDMGHDGMDHGASTDCTGDVAAFYPSVAMAMGVKGVLKGGDSDQIPNMQTGGMMARNYHIFKDSIDQGDSSYHAHVYIAATETMHNFPGLTEGLMLNEGMGHALMISSLLVEFSADDGATWVTATNGHGGGMWAAEMAGTADKLLVKLTINDDIKTEDGLVGGINYVELTVSGDMAM